MNINIKRSYQTLLKEAGVRMIDSHLTVGTWGNISCCDREHNIMYITPSGMNYYEIEESDINAYDLEGNLLYGMRRPSIEIEMHRALYNERKEISAVLHTHPIYSTVFSSIGENIPINIHDEAAQTFGDDIRCADYALPGTAELAHNACRAIGTKSNACMLRNHGLVCIGDSMDNAFKVATVVEMVGEIYWRIQATGKSYIPISTSNVQAMQEFVKTKYGRY